MAAFVLTVVASWGIYALLGMGIVLVYRTSRVLNIAGGEIAIFIGYLVALAIEHGLPWAWRAPSRSGLPCSGSRSDASWARRPLWASC